MKSIVIYYSYSGNTQKVTEILVDYLKQKGEVEVIKLEAIDESDKFLTQAFRAFRHKRAKITSVTSDLTKYDLVCLGTPVWAFAPTPAINTYLDRCFGLER